MSALELVLLDCKVQCVYFGTVFAEPEARRRKECHVCHYISQTDIFPKDLFSDLFRSHVLKIRSAFVLRLTRLSERTAKGYNYEPYPYIMLLSSKCNCSNESKLCIYVPVKIHFTR